MNLGHMHFSCKQMNTKYVLECKFHEDWNPVGLIHGYTRSEINVWFFLQNEYMYVNGERK